MTEAGEVNVVDPVLESLRPTGPYRLTLTQTEAAAHVGVAKRTIRSWVEAGLLVPIPISVDVLGYPLYRVVDVVSAERARRGGRPLRRATLRDRCLSATIG